MIEEVKPLYYRNHSRKVSSFEYTKNDYQKESTNAALIQNRKKYRLIRRVLFLWTLILTVSIVTLVGWFFVSGTYKKILSTQYEWFMDNSVKLGFAIKDIYVQGRVNSSDKEISKALEIYKGQSIWDIDLNKIKQRVEDLEWIDYVSIERKLPSTLVIRIVERQAVAIWQRNGEISLIDKYGKVIDEPKDVARFANLIIMVGEEVPYYVDLLFDLLKQDEHINKNVSSVIHVGSRRWNIRLHNGIEIKLPEKEPKQALTYLTGLHKKTKILNSDIQTIDLRLNDKISIQ